MVTGARRQVVVPEVVGLPFHVARDLASDIGVTLANPDQDGPPIGALAWPGLFYVTSQDPVAGSLVSEYDSLRVTVVEHGAAHERMPQEPESRPPFLTAHAEPEPDADVIDLGNT